MGVLSRCLMDYAIDVPRYARYACTVQMGRRCYPQLPDRKLGTLCRCLGIPLLHHRADSDSLACAYLALDYMRNGLKLDRYIRTYDLWKGRTVQHAAEPISKKTPAENQNSAGVFDFIQPFSEPPQYSQQPLAVRCGGWRRTRDR